MRKLRKYSKYNYACRDGCDRRVRRPPARTGEWGGVLRGARASRNRADTAVGGDGAKKRQRFRRKAARYAR